MMELTQGKRERERKKERKKMNDKDCWWNFLTCINHLFKIYFPLSSGEEIQQNTWNCLNNSTVPFTLKYNNPGNDSKKAFLLGCQSKNKKYIVGMWQ